MPKINPEPRLVHYPEIMTVEEVASYVQVGIKTVERDVQSGIFPHFKLGSLTRFKKSVVDQWAEGKTRGFEIIHTRTP